MFLCQICSPYLHRKVIQMFDLFLHEETFAVHSGFYDLFPLLLVYEKHVKGSS